MRVEPICRILFSTFFSLYTYKNIYNIHARIIFLMFVAVSPLIRALRCDDCRASAFIRPMISNCTFAWLLSERADPSPNNS